MTTPSLRFSSLLIETFQEVGRGVYFFIAPSLRFSSPPIESFPKVVSGRFTFYSYLITPCLRFSSPSIDPCILDYTKFKMLMSHKRNFSFVFQILSSEGCQIFHLQLFSRLPECAVCLLPGERSQSRQTQRLRNHIQIHTGKGAMSVSFEFNRN